MSGHKFHFEVAMSCSGCSGAVERVLKRLDGVDKFDVSLEAQTVDVETKDSVDFDTVYQTIAKTGKSIKKGSIVY
ncbi:antioxidant and copper/iron homeostasis protein [Yamadazyma tenuis ATCC 10573]|uniref:Antioxidant and copper/iron homeostasis protein n=1 Tax=Candida tenuis (strain ATCC 10573 / BCRC 21748 / CBS 615 / JCM 9827 / NBRC 10315 / NRRL Y-1498 / VKM Y-70) TaxID=590646 RepID=G3B7Z9_CANTC|nr:antioxidant and copper/iron homeostasis protein [Yamadazyma tenuis ATCC 10573]EGV61696.1 antioxidant and copper/iron homeostasis protein [Yamadazyma tenuis ATCC 10573]